MPSFNLVDEPWLPCIRGDGRAEELSLRRALVEAREQRELFDPSPLVTVALHRLLLAVLHRAHMGPPGIDEWQELWNREHWDPAVIDAYLDRWRHRFDLFDAERPFYQVPAMGATEAIHPIGLLAQELASGNNVTLFDHSLSADPLALPPAAAARYLVARQAFSIGFGRSQPFYFADSPALRGYGVLAFGDNLFETLALNLMPYNSNRPIPWQGEDEAAWEQDRPATPDHAGTPPRGFVDYLTWQSRRIRLIAEGDGTPFVRRCQLGQNLKLAGDRRDPFKGYVVDRAVGTYARGFRPDRALWRDSHALLQQGAPGSERPDLFNHLSRVDLLRDRGAIAARPVYAFGCFGLATEQGNAASVVLWRQERLPLPLFYLDDRDLTTRLGEALALADAAKDVLRGSARRLAKLLLAPGSDDPNQRQPKKEDIEPLLTHLAPERRYWPRLEVTFKHLLVRLPGDRTEEDGSIDYGRRELPTWAREVRSAARAAFEETTRGLDGSARTLKAAVQAQSVFDARLHKVIHPFLASEESRETEEANEPTK